MIMKEINNYINEGRLSVRTTVTDNNQKYSIVCYTKDQFFNHEWDSITIEHRGKIYKDDGSTINFPFKKIFNLNEHESTSYEVVMNLVQNHDFELLDKVNGHLTIVSYDKEFNNVLVSTKGSFSGELADFDRQVIMRKRIDEVIKSEGLNYTFMFECLADYDKHLWFEEARKQYNVTENTMILLGVINNETQESVDHDTLTYIAGLFNVPVVRRFKDFEQKNIVLDDLFSHKNTEGYVFHFPVLNFRFKVKTTEYVTLRYMKEITPEKIVNVLYNSGKENLYKEFDEEIYPILDALMFDLEEFYFDHCVNVHKLNYLNVTKWSKREIAESEYLTQHEKNYVFGKNDIQSKSVRKMFKDNGHFPVTKHEIEKFFNKTLYSDVVFV